MPAIQTMGAFFGIKALRRYVINAHFRAFGIALIRCIYSKPQTEERRRWQSTSGFLNSRRNFDCNQLLHVGDYQIAGGKELRQARRRRQDTSRSIDRINIDRVADLDIELQSCRIRHQIRNRRPGKR